jgi:hypothetical protein
MRALALLAVLAACGTPSPPTVNPPPPPPPSAAPDAAFAQPPPDASPGPVAACGADETHCCQPDGTIVKPGGCQPSYPGGVEPATERAPDGTCRRIECYLKCLPEGAMIATPDGDVPVTRLEVGDPIWTADAAGARVASRVARVGSVERTGRHEVVELTLADGRVVRASAGHPDAEGRPVGELAAGDLLDGAAVRAVRRIGYDGARTWDVLPEGPTGVYWADGVRLGSTLPRW